jgi:hypothetical protein
MQLFLAKLPGEQSNMLARLLSYAQRGKVVRRRSDLISFWGMNGEAQREIPYRTHRTRDSVFSGLSYIGLHESTIFVVENS